ncbi:glycosyltransferase [Patescibacteria group bacterium]
MTKNKAKKVAELSVFFPAYNEEENIKTTVLKAVAVLEKIAIKWEILVIDDGSKDKTADIVKSIAKEDKNIRLIQHKKNRGYGGALKTGLYKSKYNLIAFTDSDGQFDFIEIKKFIPKLKKADLVIGYRKKRTDNYFRRFVAFLLRMWNIALFGLNVKDVDCGFKVFKRQVIETIGKLSTESAITETEFVVRSKLNKFKIAEVGVDHHSREKGEQTGGKLKIISKALFESLKFLPIFYASLFKKDKKLFVLMAIILLAAFLRLYKIGDFMTFLGDEGRDVLVVKRMIVDKKLTLLGPVTSVGRMHLGPLYYYMMIIPLIVAGFNPVGPAIMIALFGILTVYLVYLVGKTFYSPVSGLVAALLYAVSPVVVNFSRNSWNPNSVPFFSLLSFYCLLKAFKGKYKCLIYPLMSIFILAQLHFMALAMAPFILLTLIIIFIKAKKDNKVKQFIKYNLVSLFLGLIIFFPFILFNLRHDFINIKELLNFIPDNVGISRSNLPLSERSFSLLIQLYNSLLGLGNKFYTYLLILLSAIGLLSIFTNKKTRWFKIILLLYLLLGIITASFYGGQKHDYYLGYLFPAPFLLSTLFLKKLINKNITIIVALVFSLALFIPAISKNKIFEENLYSQKDKAEGIARAIVDDANGESFNLVLFTPAKDFRALAIRYFSEVFTGKIISYEDYSDSKYLYAVVEDGTEDPAKVNIFEITSFGPKNKIKEFIAEESKVIKYSR